METDDVMESGAIKPIEIDRKLEVLANFDELKPLEFSEHELQVMRGMLEKGGCNLELNSEDREALMHSQFRNLNQGKGQAVVAMLGNDRTEKLLSLCRSLREEGPRIISSKTSDPIEGTEGRGERQAAAELLALGVFASEPNNVRQTLDRLNTRIWKGARKVTPDNLKNHIEVVFKNAKVVEPKKTVASVLPVNIYPIWMYLTGREIEQ